MRLPIGWESACDRTVAVLIRDKAPVAAVCRSRASRSGKHCEDLLGDRQQPGTRAGTVVAGPVQLEVDHPRLTRAVDRVPAEAQVAGQIAGFRADIRPLLPVQVDAR